MSSDIATFGTAAVVAFAGFGGSWLTLRSKRADDREHRLWQARREDYGAFLASVSDVRNTLSEAISIMGEGYPSETVRVVEPAAEVPEASARVATALRQGLVAIKAMHSAQARVLISGPKRAADHTRRPVAQAGLDLYNGLMKQHLLGHDVNFILGDALEAHLSELLDGEEAFANFAQSVLKATD